MSSRVIFSINCDLYPLEIISEGDSPPVNEREMKVGLNWSKTPNVDPALRIGVLHERGRVYALNWLREMKQSGISKARMNGRVKRVGDQTGSDPSIESSGRGGEGDFSGFQDTGASPKPESDGQNLTYSGCVLCVLWVGSSDRSVPNGFSGMVDGGHII